MDIHPYSYEQLLDGTLVAQVAFTISYFISSLVVSSNAFDGFNAVMLGLVFGGTIAVTYFKVRKNPSRTMYGIILGMSVILMVISLQSAIFWGQYAGCQSDSSSTSSPTMAPTSAPAARKLVAMDTDLFVSAESNFHRQLYISEQCKNKAAMRSVCAFSVFMFLSYIFKIALLVRYKNDILKSTTDREGYAAVPNPALAQPAISGKIPSSYSRPGSRYAMHISLFSLLFLCLMESFFAYF